MTLSLIVAAAENGVIGRNDGSIPWKLSADMAYFKKTTMGHPIIMGRNTYESIGRPLPGRRNIVISRNTAYLAEGCEVVSSLEAAIDKAASSGDKEIFVIGGGAVYEQALPLANVLYITLVHASPEGDVRFAYDPTQWKEVSREEHNADEKNEYAYSFCKLIRM